MGVGGDIISSGAHVGVWGGVVMRAHAAFCGSRGMSGEPDMSGSPTKVKPGTKKVIPVPKKVAGMPKPSPFDGSDGTVKILDQSEVVGNPVTGERLTTTEYKKMASWTVLRIFEDGTKEEMTLAECVEDAKEEGLKTVLVAKNAKPPVVKLMDFGKIMREKQKKDKEISKKQREESTKELRISLKIGQHDLDVKMKQCIEFFGKGHKVKIFSKLRGAEFHKSQDDALANLSRMAARVSDVAIVETAPAMNGSIASMLLRPDKEAKANAKVVDPKANAKAKGDKKAPPVSPSAAAPGKASGKKSADDDDDALR